MENKRSINVKWKLKPSRDLSVINFKLKIDKDLKLKT